MSWLSNAVQDWIRSLTTNFAQTSASDRESTLHPIVSQQPVPQIVDMVVSAVENLVGWEMTSREECEQEVTLRFVRTTRLLRFKDDITVHIRPKKEHLVPLIFEISAQSQSRVGIGDFGQNRRNLMELMDTLRTLLR